jgi:hypothetical protein
VPDDDRWAFEAETDLWDDGERPAPRAEDEPGPAGLAGRDPNAVVTVTVTPEGAVERVRLADDWKSRVDPRGLDTSVLAAANAATIEALVQQAREVQENPPSRSRADTDETPLTAYDVLRLGDAVRAEVEEISARLAVTDRPVTAASSGGHVEGTARSGRYVSLDVDPTWASIARNAEIEGELTEVLRLLRRDSMPAEHPVRHPGKATTELLNLIHDPDRLIRRVRVQDTRPSRSEELTTDE